MSGTQFEFHVTYITSVYIINMHNKLDMVGIIFLWRVWKIYMSVCKESVYLFMYLFIWCLTRAAFKLSVKCPL
jgi:hypothetical protein